MPRPFFLPTVSVSPYSLKAGSGEFTSDLTFHITVEERKVYTLSSLRFFVCSPASPASSPQLIRNTGPCSRQWGFGTHSELVTWVNNVSAPTGIVSQHEELKMKGKSIKSFQPQNTHIRVKKHFKKFKTNVTMKKTQKVVYKDFFIAILIILHTP